MLYVCFVKGFVIFPEVQPMYFCDVLVTSASLQSGALANSVFRDLVISQSLELFISCCHMFMLFPSDPCPFEDDQ